jgi:MoaA/NifB/PqqE/SkfB family radical SAM enzyme
MFKPSPFMLSGLAAHLGLAEPASATPAQLAGWEPAPEAGRLAKVYIEATTHCNLACRTCVRNGWDESLGHMPLDLYEALIDQLRSCPGPLTLVFAGYGEPTFHPHFLEMLRLAKDLGARVEIVTNGVLLDQAMAHRLADLAVDRVWFSIDGLTPDRYAAIRRGGRLDVLSDHIRQLYTVRQRNWASVPEIGMVFVAMKSNIDQLPDLYRLAATVRATDVLVTNLLPHTPDMVNEILYRRSLGMGRYAHSPEIPQVHLPRLDLDGVTSPPVLALLRHAASVTLAGADLAGDSERCPFVQDNATAVRWDGRVSPCPPLLHSHPVWVAKRWKHIEHASFGNIAETALGEIWAGEDYRTFRNRVRNFTFSPCASCGGCELAVDNVADCMGNTFPTCGGCLWAQGIVRCP